MQKTPKTTLRYVLSQIPVHQQSLTVTADSMLQSSNVQDLINQIQQTITSVSDIIKNQLQTIQYNQLLSYKDDLFKTQDQFITIRQQRNQDVIKTKIMEQKVQVESKFHVEMKKSIQMNKKYDQFKCVLKKMNQEERELKLEINYMKKKLLSTKKEGQALDEEIMAIQNKQNLSSSKNQSSPRNKENKTQQQRKLFKQIINKCDAKLDEAHPNKNQKQNIKSINQKSKNSTKYGIQFIQKSQKKRQKFLKQQIQNIKDYAQNIPLQLNFIQKKMYNLLYSDTLGLQQQDENQIERNQQVNQQDKYNNSLQKQNSKQQKNRKFQKQTKNPVQKLPLIKNSYKFQQLLKDNEVKKYIYEVLFN